MTQVSVDNASSSLPRTATYVLFAENEVLRRELAVALRRMPGVDAVHQSPDWGDVERVLRSTPIDVLILACADVQRLRALGRRGSGPRVLMLIDETQAADPGRLADLPVDGFLLRQQLSTRSLHDALRRMGAGEVPMPTVLARNLLGRVGAQSGNLRPVSLTARETEALGLLAEGLSNKQIARGLRISEHGVKRLVGSLLLKLGSPNRTSAVLTAMKLGLIDNA